MNRPILAPESISLHVYHLDDGPEADSVIRLLREGGIGNQWTIQRPSEATNSILISTVGEGAESEKWLVRNHSLRKAVELLAELNTPSVNAIKDLGLSVAIRIHTGETYLPLPVALVKECGRLGLEICVFNTQLFAINTDVGVA